MSKFTGPIRPVTTKNPPTKGYIVASLKKKDVYGTISDGRGGMIGTKNGIPLGTVVPFKASPNFEKKKLEKK